MEPQPTRTSRRDYFYGIQALFQNPRSHHLPCCSKKNFFHGNRVGFNYTWEPCDFYLSYLDLFWSRSPHGMMLLFESSVRPWIKIRNNSSRLISREYPPCLTEDCGWLWLGVWEIEFEFEFTDGLRTPKSICYRHIDIEVREPAR